MTKQCEWCQKDFQPRQSGGSPQRFCSKICKRFFERSLLRWARQQHAQGTLKIAELQCIHSLDKEKGELGT